MTKITEDWLLQSNYGEFSGRPPSLLSKNALPEALVAA